MRARLQGRCTLGAMSDRRYVLRTFGCQMNEHDSERIAGLLTADGYMPTEEAADASVVVFNTCAVRENADNRLYGNLGHLRPLKQRNPRMRIVVAGCLAQKDGGLIQERAPWVDVVVGTHALPGLLDLLHRAETDGPQLDVREQTETFPSALPALREVEHHAWVSIAVGCDNACTFCIVPLVRGPQLSRPIGDILAEVQGLARRGVVEVTLLGQNVNTYGRDLTVPDSPRRPLFADLLRAVNDVDGLRRIRFTSPHPHDFTPDVIDAMADSDKVCEHIHFPLQSGSDRVLKTMRRSYRRERYLMLARADPRCDPGHRGEHRHHRRVSRRDRGGLRGHPRRRAACAVRPGVHVPVLAEAGNARGNDVRSDPEGCRPGAVRPSRRATAGDLAGADARAGRRDRRGPRRGNGSEGPRAGSNPHEPRRPCGRRPPRPGRSST